MSFSHNRLNLTPGSLYVDKLAVRHILPIDMQNNEYSTNTIFAVAVNGELEGYDPVTWFSSIGYTDPSTIQGELVSSNTALNNAIDATNQSTVAGLGSAGYISTSQLTSTVAGLTTTTPVSLSLFYGTLAALADSPYNYVSSSQLTSTVAGLGTAGYVSTSLNGLLAVKAISTGNLTTSTVTFRDVVTSAELPLYSQNGSLYYNGLSLAASLDLSVNTIRASAYVSTATVNTQKLATPHQLMVGGSAGYVQSSANAGATWDTSYNVFGGGSMSKLYYVRGRWYALGSSGVAYSSNGISWTVIPFTFEIPLSFAYDGSIYMVGTDTGSIYTSPDGITWTSSSNLGIAINHIIYTGSHWIAVATGAPYIYYSIDGITWPASTGTMPSTGLTLACNRNIVIAGGSGGSNTNRLCYSTDNGLTWTTTGVSFTGSVNTVVWNTAYFVAGGNDSAGASPIKYSRDGRTWTNGSGISTSETVASIFWTGTKTYAATDTTVYVSTDYGRTWTALAAQPTVGTNVAISYSVEDRDDLITNNTTFYSADIPHYYNSTNQIYGAANKVIINDTLNVRAGTIGIMKGDPSADYHLDVAGAINASTIYISSVQFNDVTAGGRVGVDIAGGMLRVGGVPAFQSTVAGLGSAGYVSTGGLTSTVAGLGSAGYISTTLFVDGSGNAPSISFVNDTNTGIYRPVNKTIGFSIDGTEKMRINASGNVGIGTTNPSYVLDVSGTARIRKIVMPNGIAINRSDTANTNQNANSIAIGDSAGETSQSSGALAIGRYCGRTNQGTNATAVGYSAGASSQGQSAIALGNSAGDVTQGSFAIAIGSTAGQTSQGSEAIAIGRSAGAINQQANSIVLNATGSPLNGDLSNATYIAPIRNVPNTTGTVLYYDPIAKEVCYDALANENALSTVAGLGQIYISTSSLTSTVAGLGEIYVSTSGLTSTVAGLGEIYVSTSGLTSTVAGLGEVYVSTSGLTSTVAGLGEIYVSTGGLTSTVAGLGQIYLSTATGVFSMPILTSTVAGLGTAGYISTTFFVDGSGNAPSISFVNDTNTGIYRPSSDVMRFVTGGNDRLIIDASGRVGIGINVPAYPLDVSGTAEISKIIMPNGIAINRSNTDNTNQSVNAIAIGDSAGETSQGSGSLAIGTYCGRTNQGTNATAIGYVAGFSSQGQAAIALGNSAGEGTQGSYAIAIGSTAGQTSQGTNAIAIGRSAGAASQQANSIVLNATGSPLNGDLSNATYIAPLRTNDTTIKRVMAYDTTTKEVVATTSLYCISGNVGINATDLSGRLHIRGTSANPHLIIENDISSSYVNKIYTDGAGSLIITSDMAIPPTLYVALPKGSNTWSSLSDERSKDISYNIVDGLTKIVSLRAVIGSYKGNDIQQPFLIAQDLLNVLPEAVTCDENGRYGIKYTEVIPLLVSAFKDVSAIIEKQSEETKSELEKLIQKNEEYQSTITGQSAELAEIRTQLSTLIQKVNSL